MAENVVAFCWAGDMTLTPGVIDDEAKTCFTHGQCHALARALHERTGWQLMAGLYNEPWEIAPLVDEVRANGNHFAVRAPDGRMVDITGFWNEGEHPDWRGLVWVPVTDEIVAEMSDGNQWCEQDMDAARLFVDAVLETDEETKEAV